MRCIHCGNAVKAGDPACRHCGARVVRPSVEASASGRRSGAGVMSFLLLLLGAGLLVWVAGGEQRLPFLPGSDEAGPVPAVAPPPDAGAARAVAPPAPQSPPPTAAPAAAPIAPPAEPSAPRPPSRIRASTEPPRTAPPPPKPAAPPPPRAVTTSDASTPQPLPPPAASQPVRVGGNIAAPKKLKDVPPVYPPLAQQARVQGVVIIEATIGGDGAVRNTRVLRSIPLLDAAALDAVRQWEFAPTLLNGVAVPVIMTVTVNFSLR